MIFTFKKGRHRARPLYWLHWFIWLWKPKVIRMEIMFTGESRYDLKSADQKDWNKIFGISYTFSPFGKSARFVERYNDITDRYEIAGFVHRTGNPKNFEIEWLASMPPHQKHILELQLHDPLFYIFRVYKKENNQQLCNAALEKRHKKKSGFLLGPYFGGNRTSPVKRTYQLKKL